MKIETKNGWLFVVPEKPGIWEIREDSVTDPSGNDLVDHTRFGYSPEGERITDLDNGRSDPSQTWGISNHIRVGSDVELVGFRILAPNIEALTSALRNVTLISWCPGDM
jgi:hypothetical protein